MSRIARNPARFARIAGFAGAFAFALTCWGLVPSAQAAGGSSSTPSLPEVQESPEQNAEMHYNRGLSARDKAWKLEKQAAAAEGAQAEKLLKKAHKEFEKAVKFQRNAITANPRMHQAHSSLGYALRKIGDFEASIEAYDEALSIDPGYTEAIEYRAEAYLALNRLEEAKEAYLLLIRNDQARADELMTAMKKWLAANEGGESSVSAADLEAFASWVEERAVVAGHLAMTAPASSRNW